MNFSRKDYGKDADGDPECCSCYQLNEEAGEYGRHGYHFNAKGDILERCSAYWKKAKGLETRGETREGPEHKWRKIELAPGRLAHWHLVKPGTELEK